jgi:hypothetical protein
MMLAMNTTETTSNRSGEGTYPEAGPPASGAEAPEEPMVLNPAELRQLVDAYRDLVELHRAEVVSDEDFEDAHRLLVEQILPLRAILRQQEVVVDPHVDLTY